RTSCLGNEAGAARTGIERGISFSCSSSDHRWPSNPRRQRQDERRRARDQRRPSSDDTLSFILQHHPRLEAHGHDGELRYLQGGIPSLPRRKGQPFSKCVESLAKNSAALSVLHRGERQMCVKIMLRTAGDDQKARITEDALADTLRCERHFDATGE
ncbi:unnamed protein product, partial [Pylaiella littoralis]